MDEFERMAHHLEYGEDSGFNALFRQAQQQLDKDKPGGYLVQEIGRLAWSRLRIEGYAQTLDSLFYCYWFADRQEQEEIRLHAQALAGGQFEESALAKVRDALSDRPDDEGCVPVDFAALHTVADELVVLRKRLELLQRALDGGAS